MDRLLLCVDLKGSLRYVGGLEDWMHEVAAHDEQGEQVKFWRFCTMVLSAGLVVALLTHSGPREAGASEVQVSAMGESLRIGGFEALDGDLMFVIEDSAGDRVGVLPLTATE